MSALRGRKYTMLSEIILDRRKISKVLNVKGDKCPACVPKVPRGLREERATFKSEAGGTSSKGYPSGSIMVLMSNTSALRYSGPPHGGERKTTSPRRRGARRRKSPCTKSILSATLYTPALCCANSNRSAFMSIASTVKKKRERIQNLLAL